MANSEHLTILNNGLQLWSDWRKNNPEVQPDLSRINLSGFNFTGINFTDTNLLGTNFSESVLADANFEGANICWTNFDNAILQRASFRNTKLLDSSFKHSDIRWVDFKGADIIGADFSSSQVSGVKYDKEMKCQRVNVMNCYDSQRFVRHVLELNFIEETKERLPIKYWLWKLTSDCGRSIGQWAFISVIAAMFFGVIFAEYPVWQWLPNWLQSTLTAIGPEMRHSNPEISEGWFTPYYFSIVTFTTLGFGDVTPINTAGQIWLALEVVLGYIMLGGLITLFATKMVRQSG